MNWWRRMTHRGAHRHGQPAAPESIHAAHAAAQTERAREDQARARAAEVDAFMRDFRHAFGLTNGHGRGAA